MANKIPHITTRRYIIISIVCLCVLYLYHGCTEVGYESVIEERDNAIETLNDSIEALNDSITTLNRTITDCTNRAQTLKSMYESECSKYNDLLNDRKAFNKAITNITNHK